MPQSYLIALPTELTYSIRRSCGRLQSISVSERFEQSAHDAPHEVHARPLQVHVLVVLTIAPMGGEPEPEPGAVCQIRVGHCNIPGAHGIEPLRPCI